MKGKFDRPTPEDIAETKRAIERYLEDGGKITYLDPGPMEHSQAPTRKWGPRKVSEETKKKMSESRKLGWKKKKEAESGKEKKA